MARIIRLEFVHVERACGVATPRFSSPKSTSISSENVAVFVQPVNADSPTVTHNADRPMNPASVMKLVTTYAALEKLGPAYRWKTEVYRDGEVRNGVLRGNLILKGYGDPNFQAQDFWRLLMRLQQLGIPKCSRQSDH